MYGGGRMSDAEKLAQIFARIENGLYQSHEACEVAHEDIIELARMLSGREQQCEIMRETLTRCQRECSALVEENRKLKAELEELRWRIAGLEK